MYTGAITSYIDVAQLVLYASWIFFAALITYLRKEDKREGYPLDSDRAGGVKVVGWPSLPKPKTFVMPHGHGVRVVPREEARQPINATPVAAWPGAPLGPDGDPMLAGVGPGACPIRPDEPDLTVDGRPKIIPMRCDEGFSVAKGDKDPRGYTVVGADGVAAGTVRELWVDTGEPQIRYLEVALPMAAAAPAPAPVPEPAPAPAPVVVEPAAAEAVALDENGEPLAVDAETPFEAEPEPVAAPAPAPTPVVAPAPVPVLDTVLVPINFCLIRARQRLVKVAAIRGAHFADVPRLADPDRVTLREEDRITAYFGGGTLYAMPGRAEPLL